MRIMLIDDDKDFCYLTQKALMKQGYEVSIFHDAVAGITHAKTNKPNLILMDVMLPGVAGPEAVRALKADPQIKDVPIVFLTGLVGGQEEGLQDAGVNVDGLNYRTLGKPYEIDTLLETVKKNVR